MTNTTDTPNFSQILDDVSDQDLSREEKADLLKLAIAEDWTVYQLSAQIVCSVRDERRLKEARRLIESLSYGTAEETKVYEIMVDQSSPLHRGGFFGKFDCEYGARVSKVRVSVTRYRGIDDEPYVRAEALVYPLTKAGTTNLKVKPYWASLPSDIATLLLGKIATS